MNRNAETERALKDAVVVERIVELHDLGFPVVVFETLETNVFVRAYGMIGDKQVAVTGHSTRQGYREALVRAAAEARTGIREYTMRRKEGTKELLANAG